LVFLFLSFTIQAQDSYTLTIEASTPAVAPGTTYRLYVDMLNPTDSISAVFGNNDSNLIINTPDGAFNSPVNSSWSASGINPAFCLYS
jgi:hypothetical protein